MKRIPTLLFAFAFTITATAQIPQKMSYQCVIRNSNEGLVINQSVGIRISILQGTTLGAVVYQETYNPNPQTNANGLISLEIGGGLPITGIFSNIDWASGPYFLKTETDPTGGTSYTIVGTTQLLSVPYALYAKTAGNGFSGNYNDLLNKPILFSGNYNDLRNTPTLFNGTWASITGKPTTIAGYGITDAITTTGNQTIAGNKTFTGTISVPTPINPQDAATKSFVDGLKLQIKALEDNLIATGTYKLSDVEGNQYKVVKIGNQVWTAENLKVTHFSDGTSIPHITDGFPGYCWYNNDSSTNKETYGALYNFAAVATYKLCPTGWQVPSESEWDTLITFLGGDLVAGGKLKETGTSHWNSPNTGATNETGFTALPAGGMLYGTFQQMGTNGYWWSRKQQTLAEPESFYERLDYNLSNSYGSIQNGWYGLSIRCLKDAGPTLTTDSVTATHTNVPGTSIITVKSGGHIIDDNGLEITHKGICWSGSTGDENIGSRGSTDEGGGADSFKSTFSTEYNGTYSSLYIRAYATNAAGTGYGNEVFVDTRVIPETPGK
jgi:uncharacterized protein (TIGR02145 family)